ncbi:hypothetical protein ACRALDRAFT_2029750 [Sodiomyces alcalophilus JCM 7366]|uniref:uncharacterized protein n=1 Tax=Sodiomyces alcalophilus JCM 7366 TaxID=591952 RepID=UPI0039B5241D
MADQDTVTLVNPKLAELGASYASLQKPLPAHHFRAATINPDPLHKHNDSTSTQASESAESSPTTTLSTTDSSPLSDPSPSSSPDSPIKLIPLSSFPGTSFGALSPLNSLTIPENSCVTSNGRPMTSPAPRRPKNMKGLSIQPPCLNTAVTNTRTMTSEPASPAFIKPTIHAMRRKPSQLSLKTSSSDLMAKTTLEVPGTPALPPILQRRALKHSTSSPHMLSGLKSAAHGPVGGMTFPKVLERNESGLSEVLRPTKTGVAASFGSAITEEMSPIRTQLANRAAIDSEPYHEQEHNEDQKSPGYPEGPLAIYDSDVFLYSEPTAEEAARFDVVINVAREVNNPFDNIRPVEQVASDDSRIPDTAVTTASFATAFEFPPTEGDQAAETPTTPRAPVFPLRRPEYMHIPWDHNTDIAPDLMGLCETIEARTKEGKTVLVHCQQGASRSASLIIAYGLYRNPDLSVNDAYYAAQAKSRWISPNMKLMYCLQDFQKQVAKRKSLSSSYRPRSGRSPSKHRLTLSADAIELPAKEPRTAPLPDDSEGTYRNGSPSAHDGPGRARGYSTPGSQPISPGPSSAPSSFAWSEKESGQNPTMPAQFDLDRLLPRNVPDPPQLRPPDASPCEPLGFTFIFPDIKSSAPCELKVPEPSYSTKPPPSPGFGAHRFGSPGGLGFSSLNLEAPPSERRQVGERSEVVEREVSMVGAYPDDAALMSPRAETMTHNPLREPCTEVAGMHFVEVPPTPGDSLFSPRETMFPRDPFAPFGRPPQFADPRSPPTTGETPIVRSIDEIL